MIVREARGVDEEGEEDDDGDGRGHKEGGKGRGVNGGENGKGEEEKVDIRIPEKAVAEAATVVKGVLEKKVELEPEGKGFWD